MPETPEPRDRPETPPPAHGGHERSDISVRWVLIFGVFLGVLAVVVHVGLWLLFDVYAASGPAAQGNPYPLAAEEQPTWPPPPLLEGLDPSHQVGREAPRSLAGQAAQAARLDRYDWVDEKAGIVQIPIDRAMEQMVQENARKDAPPAPANPGEARDSSSGRFVPRGKP